MESLHVGDKVYYINREKSMYLAIIGNENIENGLLRSSLHENT